MPVGERNEGQRCAAFCFRKSCNNLTSGDSDGKPAGGTDKLPEKADLPDEEENVISWTNRDTRKLYVYP